MNRSRRLSVILLMLAVLIAIPAVVAATDLDGNISVGSGQWGDEHTLCDGCTYESGNIVGVWQAIMWADGFLGKCGSSGVDGYFGSGTHNATEDWQEAHNLGTGDGIVGSNTWGKADNYVVSLSAKNAKYDGDDNSFQFYAPGTWTWKFGWQLQWNTTGHPTPDFPTC